MRPSPTQHRVLVIGAVGRAGAAVLRERLGRVDAVPVTVLCTRAFAHLPRGLGHAVVDGDGWRAGLPHVSPSDEVVIVLDTRRHAREAVFWRPERAALVALMQALHARGVRRLELVHAPGHTPNAAERAAVQALGYGAREARVRPPSPRPGEAVTGGWLERLAAWMLRTLIDTLYALGMRPPR
ncbi:hypothetical protein DY262_09955 [Hydrogenophaga borbori]|uniref:NAD(P)-binding domain-containing protein n=1 Tax=Hydrogenophaga borbori TaxID=2294117 RepID=A0A372EK64_9BURK|nr:hypothetical protein [Hydrogenophaga borbori]RFP79290.1 hypothetical protein DY262_09955 [Hydrogenophaga borbori]